MLIGAQEEILPLFTLQLPKINLWVRWMVTRGPDQGQVPGVSAAWMPSGPCGELERVVLQHSTRTWWDKIQIIWKLASSSILRWQRDGGWSLNSCFLLFISPCDAGWQFGILFDKAKECICARGHCCPQCSEGISQAPAALCTPGTGTGQGSCPKRNGIT